MLPINKKISYYNHYSGNQGRKYIVIHSTGNVEDTAKNNVDYFSRANRGASAHFFVDDNSIWQSVEEYDSAWHCGDGNGEYGISNTNSISIEMCGTDCGRISNTTVNNTIELVRYLMNKYNIDIDHVVRHYDASRKCCPQQFSCNNWARWFEFKNTLVNINKSQNNIKVGNKVKVIGNNYATGQIIPRWVKSKNYTIQQINDDKALLKEITSWVYIKDLIIINTPTWISLDGKIGVCTGEGVRVRDVRNRNNILGHLHKGTKLDLFRLEGDWMHIYYPPHGGYVSTKYIKY